DVDAQLQGVGAGDAQELAFKQLPLDLPAFGRQVAAAVRPDRPGQAGLAPLQLLPGVAVEELRHHPGSGEGDGLHPLRNELDHDLLSLGVAAPALHGLADPGRIPEDEVLLAPGRTVVVDHRAPTAGEALRVFARV